MLAITGSSWVQVVLTGSIVVPLAIVIVVVVVFFRRAKDDPDAERLKRAQAEYEARQGR